jgi:hypothetical protein
MLPDELWIYPFTRLAVTICECITDGMVEPSENSVGCLPVSFTWIQRRFIYIFMTGVIQFIHKVAEHGRCRSPDDDDDDDDDDDGRC